MRFVVLAFWLVCSPVWAQDLAPTLKKIVARYPDMRAGVAVVHLPSGEKTELDGHTPYPLASVFKLPVMLELARQLQAGQRGLNLSQELSLQAADKCIGSGHLKDQPVGTPVALERCVELMETISDNTATDMVFHLIGLESVNRMLHELGLKDSDVSLTNRQAWLISLGHSSDFKGLGPRAIAARWQALGAEQRHAAALRAESENRNLSLTDFQRLEDASAAHQSHAEDVLVAETVDNQASPNDLADLLVRLQQGKLLDSRWSAYCLGVLGRQKYNTRIPRLLPPGTRVYHKTGTIAGVVNDAGIIDLEEGQQLVVVVLVRGVGSGRSAAANDLIAKVAKAVYDYYRP